MREEGGSYILPTQGTKFRETVYCDGLLRCLYHVIETWGDDLAKNGGFQQKQLNLVGNFLENVSALRAGPLPSHRKIGRGRFGENCRFSNQTFGFGGHFI